jgi:hypothetical protein
MALLRPLKEGTVRTYQEKVGLGFTDILASEADADFDTIYGAWNGGVGTANLIDGSVTSPKLATDAVGSLQLAAGAVTIAKMAVGAAVRGAASTPMAETVASGATLVTFATLNITLSGGLVEIKGELVGTVQDLTGTAVNKWAEVQLWRGAGVLRRWLVPIASPSTVLIAMAFPIFYYEVGVSGAVTYSVKVFTEPNALFRSDLFSGTNRAGSLNVVEFA